MKGKSACSILLGAVLAVAAAPAAALPPVVDVKAEIPFDFYVGGERLPAGTYIVESFPETANAPVLTVERAEPAEGETHFASVATIPLRPTDPQEDAPRLVFEQVGDVNLLARVVPADGTVRKIER